MAVCHSSGMPDPEKDPKPQAPERKDPPRRESPRKDPPPREPERRDPESPRPEGDPLPGPGQTPPTAASPPRLP
jgi:hypothetical protein